MEQEEYEAMQKLALEQLRAGKSLTGKGGAFAPLLKQFLESALEAEMSGHLTEAERLSGNKRNGKGRKTLKTMDGEIELITPEDRQSSFQPQIVRKRETVLADNLASKILGLYGLGMSLRDISAHIEEMYDVEISHNTLSEITDRVIPQVREWQSRPLEKMYTIVWLDAMHYRVRDEGAGKQPGVVQRAGHQ
jgi:putative transposase